MTTHNTASTSRGDPDAPTPPAPAPRPGQPSPAPACPHSLRGGTSTSDYCQYIQPQRVISTTAAGRTASDQFLICGLASAALWWRLRQRDLQLITSCSDEHRTAKLRRRLRTVDDLLTRHAELLSRTDPDIWALTFQVDPEQTISTLFPASTPPAAPAWAEAAAARLQDSFRRVLRALPGPRPELGITQLIDITALLAAADDTLARYHSASTAAASIADVNDPLMFMTAHQGPELWFHAALAAVEELRRHLRGNCSLVQAASLAARLAGTMWLFVESIKIPQTMTPAEYMRFRPELRTGSGAESVQFRAFELSLIRDDRLFARLGRYGLMTPDLAAQYARPSLNEELLARLAEESLTGDGTQDAVAARLASLLRANQDPPGLPGLLALMDALLDLEQAWDTWRVVHIGMVDRMMGGQRRGLGMSGRPDGPADGRPFLSHTLNWGRMFPALWRARDYL
ncbi:tryptophan 2,3-dioxygenase family protein [Streptomyces sp. NPDC008121]|uniref:tryptophan 2,3-dioxygenase family protein n=1 Tax=Streptomyces sp. NPDC008121 TaxID=3364809 RepID=UPI0036E7EE35